MSATHWLAILPYLKTAEPVCIRGIDFRSSMDLAGLSASVAEQLRTLFKMFFLYDNRRIKSMTYAVIETTSGEEQTLSALRRLAEARTLISYFYSSPHPTSADSFLSDEHASLYRFASDHLPESLLRHDYNTEGTGQEDTYPGPDERDLVPAYAGSLHNDMPMWVSAGSRIYPPVPHMFLNISQSLNADFTREFSETHQHALASLVSNSRERNPEDDRLFTALEWYNRANAFHVRQEVAIIALSTAFETLLDLKQGDELTSRFKESVAILLGRFPRLDSWLDQFYKARSAVVHRGRSSDLLFKATDNPKAQQKDRASSYRSLVAYGRQIFQLCFATVVYGSVSARRAGLRALLETNEERVARIHSKLSSTKGTSLQRLESVSQEMAEVHRYMFVPEEKLTVAMLVSATKMVISAFLESAPGMAEDLLAKMHELNDRKQADPDDYEALVVLNEIQEKMPDMAWYSGTGGVDLQSSVAMFVKAVWNYTFHYFYALERERREQVEGVDGHSE